MSKVFIFWDNSNIFISAKHVADQKEGYYAKNDVRISFDNLFALAHANRTVVLGIVAGSVPPEHKGVWEKFKKTIENKGIALRLLEKGTLSNKEQGVDEVIQVEMLRAALDQEQPQVAVVMTGDGKGYDDGVGFHADLERMKKKGWGIEVIAWDISCKATLKKWAQENGIYIKLEDYYDQVTFLESTRQTKHMNLTNRPTASPASIATCEPSVASSDKVTERRRKKALARSQNNSQRKK